MDGGVFADEDELLPFCVIIDVERVDSIRLIKLLALTAAVGELLAAFTFSKLSTLLFTLVACNFPLALLEALLMSFQVQPQPSKALCTGKHIKNLMET
jgi:hypothetical protein